MSCAIAVMAKAPVPGRCKTRLVPPLSAESAAGLSRAFLRDMTARLTELPGVAPFAAYAPAGTEAALRDIVAPGTALFLADGAEIAAEGVEGFGRCLLQAVTTLLHRGHRSACVLNSDSPTLPAPILARAAQLLEGADDTVVLGPATDGGYYLLGMKAPHAALFADIAWSTGIVAAQTRARAASAGLRLVELPEWYDVDDREGLAALRRDLGTGEGASAPHTKAFLADAGLLTLQPS